MRKDWAKIKAMADLVNDDPRGIGEANKALIRRMLGRIHVATSPERVAAEMLKKLGGKRVWALYNDRVKREIARTIAEAHAENVRLYCDVMGHGPIPSVETIELAMLGDEDAKREIIG